jgi:hypothetical protein
MRAAIAGLGLGSLPHTPTYDNRDNGSIERRETSGIQRGQGTIRRIMALALSRPRPHEAPLFIARSSPWCWRHSWRLREPRLPDFAAASP